MAINVNDCATVGSSLFYAGAQALDPKTHVNFLSELETLRPFLPAYACVVVEQEPDYEGTIWQMQPDEEDGFIMLNVTGNSAQIDDAIIDDETVYSSLKVENTFAKLADTYTKTETDGLYGTLTQQNTNTTDIASLKTKTDSLSSAMKYKGNLATYGELLLLTDMTNGDMYIIESDETREFISTKYIYNGENWIFNGINEVAVRNFETNPVNLGEEIVNDDGSTSWVTEVRGKLKLDSVALDGLDANNVSYVNGEFNTVKEALDSLLYKALTITFTTGSPTSLEKGNSLTSITFAFNYNKDTVIQQSINGEVIPVGQKTYTYTGLVNIDTTFTLSATDEKQSYTKSITFKFYSAIKYGSAEIPDTYDSNFVNGLSGKKLSGSCKGDYTIPCADEQYVYFAIPTSIASNLRWFVGGFEGGISEITQIEVENEYNNITEYTIFKSDNKSLGTVALEIK